MNMISQLRQRIARTGTATITTEEFNQLQGEWITRTKMEKEELTAIPVERLVIKPCPFCGGEATVFKFGNGLREMGCNNKDCEIKPGTYSVETVIEAKELWNRRAL